MELILEVMAACGLQPWGIPGFEADDLIGHCVMKYRHRFDRIYAATNDSDPFQLLWCDNFYLYRKELKDVVTGDKLVDPFGRPITPDQYMLATALMGTHNDIDGIPRVGAGTAFKALHDPALMRKLRDGHSDLIERNLRLIKLPHEAFPREASLPTHQSFNPRTLYRALGKYDIEVTGAVERAFQELFGR
jgi:5'-3' exonuclease